MFVYNSFWILILSKVIECGVTNRSPSDGMDISDDGEQWRTINFWPYGVIPYLIPDDMYSDTERGILLSAMRRWEAKTCIKFVPWTDETIYIKFFSAGGCFSRNGYEKIQPQLIGIGTGCKQLPIVIHELGHAIGMVHEMERNDRHRFIQINYDNMNDDSSRNYETTDRKKILYPLFLKPYDYKSIMHYGPKVVYLFFAMKAWSSNGGVVIKTKDPAYQNIIGQSTDVSFFDALYVNRAYDCKAKCSKSLEGLCRNGGFLGGPDCRCICQDGFAGQFCGQPLLGYGKIINWNCGKGNHYYSGSCYDFNTDSALQFRNARNVCARNNASMATIKTRPEMEWMSRMTKEKNAIYMKKSFWVGITRKANDKDITWYDGSMVDTNLISLVDRSSQNQEACGKFDGESIILSSCDVDEDNGVLCQKDFDTACGGRLKVGDSTVNIRSPGYPYTYLGDLECTYFIETSIDSRIRITFDEFLLENSNDCSNDYVDVKLTNDATKEGKKYCDKDLNGESLVSENNVAILTFRSNSRLSFMGFKASIEEVKSYTWTYPNGFSYLGALSNALTPDGAPTSEAKDSWRIGALFDWAKNMAMSKVLK